MQSHASHSNTSSRPRWTPDSAAAIEAVNLFKTYHAGSKRVQALQDVSFSVHKGAIFGLLGPNGAGKTTLTKILTTLSTPDAGHVTVAGIDVMREPEQVRRLIGYVPQRSSFDPVLTGRENLVLQGNIFGLPRPGPRVLPAILAAFAESRSEIASISAASPFLDEVYLGIVASREALGANPGWNAIWPPFALLVALAAVMSWLATRADAKPPDDPPVPTKTVVLLGVADPKPIGIAHPVTFVRPHPTINKPDGHEVRTNGVAQPIEFALGVFSCDKRLAEWRMNHYGIYRFPFVSNFHRSTRIALLHHSKLSGYQL